MRGSAETRRGPGRCASQPYVARAVSQPPLKVHAHGTGGDDYHEPPLKPPPEEPPPPEKPEPPLKLPPGKPEPPEELFEADHAVAAAACAIE